MVTSKYTYKLKDNVKSKQWSEKNNIDIDKVSLYSRKKYWFKCKDCSHDFLSIVCNFIRTDGNGCPYCNSKLLCDCKICYNKSLASNPLSKNIIDKTLQLNKIFKGTMKKYEIKCEKCHHISKRIPRTFHMCSYCNGKNLCLDNNCNHCLNRSFASNEKSKYWSNKNNQQPRELLKNSMKQIWLNCNKCRHIFKKRLNDISSKDSWCPFCVNQKLCRDEKCIECFNKSFASHPKAKYWSDKNKKQPREVFLQSNKTYIWFNCPICKLEFKKNIYNVTNRNSWCPDCSSTHLETCMKLVLRKLNIEYEEEKIFKLSKREWIKYDFYLPRYNLFIEMDGIQHFKYTHWFHKSKKKFRKDILRDIMKNYFALKNGYKILRITYLDDDYIENILLSCLRMNKNILFSNRKLYKKIYNHII